MKLDTHQIVPFEALSPAPELLVGEDAKVGRRTQVLASDDGVVVVTYLPVGGDVSLKVGPGRVSQWFDPRTGELRHAEGVEAGGTTRFMAPTSGGSYRPADWVLLTRIPTR